MHVVLKRLHALRLHLVVVIPSILYQGAHTLTSFTLQTTFCINMLLFIASPVIPVMMAGSTMAVNRLSHRHRTYRCSLNSRTYSRPLNRCATSLQNRAILTIANHFV